MKKQVCVFLSLVLLCGCNFGEYQSRENTPADTFIKGVWISYSEINSMCDSGDFKTEFSVAADNIKKLGITDAFIHVRAFGDSLFDSEFYPLNPRLEQYDFDVLKYMIDVCHNLKIRFHAWINPYRKSDGSFSDPADNTALANIINGIREILNNYDVDGIHFDDYFYPSQDESFDAESYAAYCAETENPLSLSEFRMANINTLVSSAYTAVKFIDKNIIFSISPAACRQKNKDEFFADVEQWCKNGCIDYIIPQIYFGFDYPDENYRFESLLREWKEVERDSGVSLVIGLPAYKLGTDSNPDSEEWKEGDDILKRQTEICFFDEAVSGVCYFSYSYLFMQDDLHRTSTESIKQILDDCEQMLSGIY